MEVQVRDIDVCAIINKGEWDQNNHTALDTFIIYVNKSHNSSKKQDTNLHI